ncbi:LuxR C-terminal-related transcriptional regulator [Krasilnikovia sp. MM14-A1259]
MLSYAASPGNVVIAGAAGMGKTELGRAAVSRLSRGEATVVPVLATRSSAGLPYGAFAHLLPATPQVAPGAQRWVADALMQLGHGNRPLFFVDDAHLLDPASAVLVYQLVAAGRARAILTIRTGARVPDPITALWKAELASRVDLGALNRRGTGLMLGTLLAGTVTPATARQFHELSEGNPLLVRELAHAATSSGTLTGPPWRLTKPPPSTTPRLLELIDDRIGDLDAAQVELLELVALGEPLHLDHLLALSTEEVIEGCERRELVRINDTETGPEVRLAHPIFGDVVRRRCGKMRTRRLYRELCRTMLVRRGPRDVLSCAVWQLEAGLADDPISLLDAARIAWVAHDHGLAARLSQAAISAGAGPQAAILLAATHNYRQQPDSACRVLDAVESTVSTERDFAEYTLTRAFALAQQPDGLADALNTLDRAASRVTDIEWQQNLAVLRMNLLTRQISAVALLEMADGILAAGPSTAAVRAQALSSRAGAALGLGRFDTAVASAQTAIADLPAWHDVVPVLVMPVFMNWIWAAMFGGHLDAADAALDSLVDVYAGRVDVPDLDSAQRLARSQTLRLRGRLSEALDTLDPPIEQRPFAAGLHAQHAHLLALRGDAGAATQALTAAQQVGTMRYVVIEAAWIMLATPWVVAASAGAAAGVHAALAAADNCAEKGIPALELNLCHDVVRLGGAELVVDRTKSLAADAEGALPPLYAQHAAAIVAGDGDELKRLAACYHQLGYLPDAADTAAQAAVIYHRNQRTSQALRAERLAQQWADLSPGLRTSALAALRTPTLTLRQIEVARLASDGMTSKEIADHLSVNVRTVDNHLRSIYEKMHVPNRRALRDLFHDS